MKKIFFGLLFVVLGIFFVGCDYNLPSFDEYTKELEGKNMTVTTATGNDLKVVLGEYAEKFPDIALPGKVLVAGNFDEPIDIKGFISGEKQYDIDKLSKEFKGIVVDCETGLLATAFMGVKDEIIKQIEANGINFDDNLKVVSKGSYVFIGYQEFLECTYDFIPVEEPVVPAVEQ